MLEVSNMVIIGGNSRNAGKTTLACRIISRFSTNSEVIGLKVTCIRPDDDLFHGRHEEKHDSGFTISEELNAGTHKDTSKMLNAGALKVYFIRVEESFMEQAILQFMSRYINNQLIVCESRSLQAILQPGLFLMMIRADADSPKDISAYYDKADRVFYYGDDQSAISQYVEGLNFENGTIKIAN